MLALERRSVFANQNVEKAHDAHLQRLADTRKTVDNSLPAAATQNRDTAAMKRKLHRKGVMDAIYKENALLASRLCAIMQNPSEIATKIDRSVHTDRHPGTMNYKNRLIEATAIHQENLRLAERLNRVQPYYRAANMTPGVPPAIKRKSELRKKRLQSASGKRRSHLPKLSTANVGTGAHRPPDPKFVLQFSLENTRRQTKTNAASEMGSPHYYENVNPLTARSAETYDSSGGGMLTSSTNGNGLFTPRIGLSSSIASSPQNIRPIYASPNRHSIVQESGFHIILEYTKVQDGRLLDVLVAKAAFRDLFVIFGIDLESQTQFELSVSSEDACNILDGDMLVTSPENVEVWMMLVNKVRLPPLQPGEMSVLMALYSVLQEDTLLMNELGTQQNNVMSHIGGASERQQISQQEVEWGEGLELEGFESFTATDLQLGDDESVGLGPNRSDKSYSTVNEDDMKSNSIRRLISEQDVHVERLVMSHPHQDLYDNDTQVTQLFSNLSVNSSATKAQHHHPIPPSQPKQSSSTPRRVHRK